MADQNLPVQPHSSNIKLIQDLQEGNEVTFAGIYHQYHQAVLINITKLVANQYEAEDILQEVFIALWSCRQKLTPSHSVAGWLFTTSYYKSLEYLKKAVKQSLSPFTEDMQDTLILEEGHQLFETNYAEKLSILHDAIELLPPQKKLAFQLCRLEGKTYEEIAAALNVSVESAKDYVKSASQLLKRQVLAKNMTYSLAGACLWTLFLQS